MSTLINSIEHALAVAASDTVKVAKFVETSVLPVLKTAKADESTIEAVTALVSPHPISNEPWFAVLGVVINGLGRHRKQVVEGAVYRNELLAADKGGRICRVPYDASKPVDTFWDLGYFDNVAIWLAQSIGFEFRTTEPSVLPSRASIPPLCLRH